MHKRFVCYRQLSGTSLRENRIYSMLRRMHSMLTVHTDIVRLAVCYANARQVAISTLAREVTGSSTWFERCATGRVTIRSAIAVVQWLSDYWPKGLAWPSDISRPASSRESAKAASSCSPPLPHDAVLMSAATQGCALMGGNCEETAIRNSRSRSVSPVGQANAPAMCLGPSRQIASPMELCKALGVRRYVYDDVVRRYRDGTGAGRHPRAGSECGRMLTALVAAGDVRFASRRPKSAA